jgi:adenosylcobinamide-GDP ribazoletransferase
MFTARLADLKLALMILTRIPVASAALPTDATLARALWAYPVAGAVVGAISGAVYFAAARLHLPAAALALAASVLVTGALHEDGLADFCDGLGGGKDRAQKLAIMRDSRIGAYGAVALVLVFLVRWSALAAIADPLRVLLTWIAAGALSRGAIAVPLALSPAREDGLGAQAAFPPVRSSAVAALIAIGLSLALLHWAAVPMISAAVIGALAVTLLARHYLGGQTGDVLGAAALIAETSALAAASAGWI